MFEQSFVGTTKTRRHWTVLLAFAGQVLAIGALLTIPLFFIQSLPVTQLASNILLAPPPPPPPPPPPAPTVHAAKAIHTSPRKLDMSQLIAPKTIPKQIAAVNDVQELPPPSEVAGVVGGVPGGVPGGVIGGVIGGLPSAAAPPPPPPKAEAPKAATPARVRLGGNVQAAKLIYEVQPEYPVLARDARIAGTVRLQAVISKEGKVEDLKLLSGQPLLVEAAMDAVKQWVYKPTYLNGVPVEVLTEVDVNFHLSS